MNYPLLQQLLAECAQYEAENPGSRAELPHFAQWLHLRHTPVARDQFPGKQSAGETLESVLSKLLIFLNRYAKMHTKKALEGSALGGIDEFVFLLSLMFSPAGMNKTELIRQHRHEKPTGMEIIKRLIAMGLVQQVASTVDRRSTVLQIQPEGRAVAYALWDKMDELSKIIAGNLTQEEKVQLVGLLDKLEVFHAKNLNY